MYLRLAFNFIRSPIITKQIMRSMTVVPTMSVLSNHKLFLYNLSQLRLELFETEDANDDLELLADKKRSQQEEWIKIHQNDIQIKRYQ